ncbi:unnamed protein product [Meganyctiphanes norvegica]|uniref:Peptidase S54 rhomboid domain-containing protein n=1 Tax=Meganyctiphanes norvegica TaxID=48144 RepID=A0AAV2R950_MEGNR
MSQWDVVKESFVKELNEFFGLEEDDSENVQLWEDRRLRNFNRNNVQRRDKVVPHVEGYVGVPQGIPDTVDADASQRPIPPKESIPKMTFKYVAGMLVNRKSQAAKQSGPSDDRFSLQSLTKQHEGQAPAFGAVAEAAISAEMGNATEDHDRVKQRDTIDDGSKENEKSKCSGITNWMCKKNIREFGKGRFTGREMKEDKKKEVWSDLDNFDDYRPYFTWWVTTVQVFILLFSIISYGCAPLDYKIHQQSGQVLMLSLSIQEVDFWEPSNIWIGPRAADLIHLGAKFAPCMRQDEKIFNNIKDQRQEEGDTGCCIRNDNSGCVQASRRECSTRLSVWKKWSESMKGPDGRLSGSVCGQDPQYCTDPASVPPHEWPDDITRWPICHKSVGAVKKISGNEYEHMTCEVIGHPCCIGIHGECRIATREYCDFVRGYFHEEAHLCSQVSCLNEVCGMIPFYNQDVPNQFYRLWMSLFIHAGVFQLVITVGLQLYFMRDLEKMAGPLRIGIIYIVSGIGGNLASSIFVPYRAEVGPSGSHFGLLACLFVEVINSWQLYVHPWKELLKLICFTLLLFLIGFLPWVDNYAHIFGFIFGFLLSYALLPYVTFGKRYERRKKILLICLCLAGVVAMLAVLIILFYEMPIYDCKICEYLNCIPWPFTEDMCAEQNINFNKIIDVL